MTSPAVDRTLAAVASGIDAAVDAATGADPGRATPCPGWQVHDLVRHLEAIAGAYVLWAGAALGGRVMRMRAGDDLAAYNDLMLQRLPDLPTRDHVVRFHDLATDHVRLVAAAWDVPMMHAPGDVVLTVGDHAAIAAVEWHVHAWDLASSAGRIHRPEAAILGVLCSAWDVTLAPVTGADRHASDDAWASLLTATGRTA